LLINLAYSLFFCLQPLRKSIQAELPNDSVSNNSADVKSDKKADSVIVVEEKPG